MGKPENVVEDHIVRKSEELGFLCYKFSSPSRRGVPDRLLIGHGLTFFIEAKAPGETLRPLQVSVMSRMIRHGATVAVIDRKAQADRFLRELDEGRYKPAVLERLAADTHPTELSDKIKDR